MKYCDSCKFIYNVNRYDLGRSNLTPTGCRKNKKKTNYYLEKACDEYE